MTTQASPAIAHTLLTAGNNTVNQKVSTTAPIAPAPNALVTLAVLGHNSTSALASPTVTGGGMAAWTEVASITFDAVATPHKRLTLYRAMSAAPGSGALTITWSASVSNCQWIVSQWDGVETGGVNGAGAIMQTGSNRGDAVSGLTVPLAAFGSASNVAYGVFGVSSKVVAVTAGAGFTEIAEQPSAESPLSDLQAEWTTNDSTIDATWTNLRGGALGVEIRGSVTLAPVASVEVTPASASVPVGGTVQLTATPQDASGTPLSGRLMTWATSDAAVATVSGSGLVTGVGMGTATITATSEGQSGSAALTVGPVPVAAVAIDPAAASVGVGATLPLRATPMDANGNPVNGRVVTWASSDEAVATVTGSGLVTGVALGPATITATSEGQGGTAAVTVAMPVAAVTVTPTPAGVQVGATVQLTATPQDASGDPLGGRLVTWASSDVVVATVSGTGLVSGVGVGSATITATSEGQSGNSAVTVTPVPVVAVDVTPASASVSVGGTVQLTATPKDASGSPLSGRSVTWASSDAAVVTVSDGGLVTGVGAGAAMVTATSEGQSGTAAVTVLVPVAAVAVNPATGSVQVGATLELTATPQDASGAPLSGRVVTWTTSDAAVATVSASGLVTGVGVGTATITAASEGQNGSAALTVIPVPVAAVTVDPAAASVGVGAIMQLTASATDANGNPLNGRVMTWVSGDEAVATVTGSGLVIGLAVGSATITATSEGKSGSSMIAVVAPLPGGGLSCLNRSGPLLAISGSQSSPFDNTSLSTNANVDARAAAWVGVSNTPIRAGGSAMCWSGGLIQGTYSASTSWAAMHDTYGMLVYSAPSAIVEGVRIHNYGDGISFNNSGSDSWIIRGVHVSIGRDDCIENDFGNSGLIEDNLFDGCYVGYSSRSYSSVPDNSGKVVTVRNTLWRLVDMPTGYNGPGHGRFWKIDPGNKDPRLALHDNIFRMDTPAACCGDYLIPPPAYLASCSNNIIVWLGSGDFPEPIPSCFTLTRDNSVWDNAVTDWLARHPDNAQQFPFPVPVASVTVSPASANLEVGAAAQLTATPNDANGNPLSERPVTWASSDAAVATVSGTGLVTGVAVGSATITATSEGQTGSSAVTVTPVPVAVVEVSPSVVSMGVGAAVQLAATPKDVAGNPLSGRMVSWATSDAGVATASGTGLVTGVALGTATITATSDGQIGTSVVTVTAPSPVSALHSMVVASPTAIAAGSGTSTITVTATDASGSPVSGVTVALSATGSGNTLTQPPGPTGASGVATGTLSSTVAESKTVSATADGVAITQTVTVTVTAGPVSGVQSTVVASPTSIPVGTGTTTVTVTAKDGNGNPINGATVVLAATGSENTLTQPAGPTDASGVATGTLRSIVAETKTVTATIDGMPITQTVTVTVQSVRTITHVLLTAGNNTVNQKLFTTASIAPAPNTLVTIAVLGHNSTSALASPTVTGGGMGAWTEVASITFDAVATPHKRLTLYRAMSAAPGSGALTITWSTAVSNCQWIVSQWDGVETGGVNGAGAIGQTGSTSGDAVNGLAVTLTAFGTANNVAYGVFGVTSKVVAVTPGAGFTEIGEQPSAESPYSDLEATWAPNLNTIDGSWTTLNGGALGVEIKAGNTGP